MLGIIVGGAAENLSSIAVLMTFNAAANGNINQGIGTALMSATTVNVTISSFICFREKISMPQLTGIVLIIGAVAILSIFAPEDDEIKHESVTEKNGSGGMLLVTAWAITASISSCI